MLLKLVSPVATEYGFPETLDYGNKNFHGTQMGISIAVINSKDGKVVRNSMPANKEKGENEQEQDKMERLNKMMNDKRILLIEDEITQMEDGNLVPRTVLYLPYFVVDHSIHKPSVLYQNISGACNVEYKVEVELLFVYDGLNRYATCKFQTKNVSIFDLVEMMFDTSEDDLASIGVHHETDPNLEEGPGWYLDFYDEAGQRYELCFSRLDRLKDALVAFRLIGLEERILPLDEC